MNIKRAKAQDGRTVTMSKRPVATHHGPVNDHIRSRALVIERIIEDKRKEREEQGGNLFRSLSEVGYD